MDAFRLFYIGSRIVFTIGSYYQFHGTGTGKFWKIPNPLEYRFSASRSWQFLRNYRLTRVYLSENNVVVRFILRKYEVIINDNNRAWYSFICENARQFEINQ